MRLPETLDACVQMLELTEKQLRECSLYRVKLVDRIAKLRQGSASAEPLPERRARRGERSAAKPPETE